MKSNAREFGQSAVEFALILPILVLILMGIFDFGRAFFAYSAVANGAREGARIGVYTASTDSQIRDAVRQYIAGMGYIPDSSITIAPSVKRFTGEAITVTVSYDFTPITPIIDSFFSGGKIVLLSSSVMHVE